MIRFSIWTFVFLILAIKSIKGNIRNPLKDPHLCGRPECDIENNKFAYQYNVRYKYDYRMHVRTEFAGSGHNSSDIFMSASVVLTFAKNCQGALSVQEIELREKPLVSADSSADNKNTADDDLSPSYDLYDYEVPETVDLHPRSDDFANNIQRNELRFAFHDGIIGEVCSAEDEDIWVLNLKKGILSAIQNTMKRFDIDYNTTETDVSGNCDVVYTLDGASGTSLSIVKTKNIASCTNRYKTNSILQTTPYDFRENYAVWPILKSESTCNISIDHNVYQSVMCYERHQLVPFSNNQSGAVTESKITMTLADEETFELSPYEEPAEIETRSQLLFNHYPSPKPTHGEIKSSRDLLREMCRLGFPDIQRDFIEVFTKFLQTARLLSYQALYQLLSRASSICTNGRNHVMESLPYIGSTSSVELMKDQIVKNQVTVDIAHKWLSSISLLPRLDVEMLKSFYSLIEYGNNKNDSIFILTSTAATHTFCRHNAAACIKVKEAKKIIRYLEDNIVKELDNKMFDRQKRTKITVMLKGLGNIGVVTKSFEITLRTIIENESLPMDIRLQAIQSHRRLDCLNSKEYFLDMYKNFTVNSEIRIAAYLQTMQCPDYISIKYIKYVLETEEVNQVGSYVWSHLNNLAKSASPVRVAAQGLLVDGDLGIKYKLDIRKFSRNFENSVFFDEYNFGGLSDANLIFGTESYLPRAASINLTADLFGESVNFFEASVRMQGFENLVQTYLGPNGPLTLAFKEKLKNASGIFSWLSWMVKDTVGSTAADDDDDVDKYNIYRSKREAQNMNIDYSAGHNVSNERVTTMTTNVKSLNYNLNYDFNTPRLAYGFKIFGNDVKYGTIEDTAEIFNTLNTFDPITQIKNILSGKEITYSKSGVFLDASYEVPLSVGLPLAIHALGASSVDIRMSGSLGSSNYLTTKQLDIEGKLKPSISVDVTATMKSDYFYGSSGVRVKSNLYSSSSIEAKVKVRGTRLISVQFSLPQDRNDLFSARSEMLVLTHERDIVQNGINKRYANSTCTWPLVDKAVGLKICADYSLPDVSNGTGAYPSLILSGPININVHLSKADTTAKTYVFEYRWDDAVNVSRGSLIFETPGSTIPRTFMANITKDLETYNVSMSFKNGDQIHSAVGTYKNTPNDKRFEIYFNINGQKNLALEMSLNRTEIKYGWVYYPRIVITVNDERIAGLAGTLKATSKKSIYQYDINLKFETKRLLTQISGYITLTDVSFTPKLKIDYLFLDNNPEAVEIDGEWSNRGHKTRTEYNGALIVKSTAYPQFNFASNLKFLSLLGHVECKLDINNSPDLIDPNYTLTLRFIFARFHVNELRSEGSRTTTSIEIARPKSNIDFKFMIKHEEKFKTGPEHNVLFLLRFAPKREATAVVSVHLPRGTLFAIDAVVNITVPAFDSCAMALRLIEKSKNEYNIDFQGTWFSGHSMIIKGMYQDKSTVVKTYYHLKLMAKSPHFEETTVDVKYWRDETELTFDLQVFYAKQPFSFLIKHSEHSINEKILYTELKLREKIYSISANMSSHNPKQLIVELHVDKLRDVHLILRGLTSDSKKEVGIEIKWDANRDPTQKIAISADFNTPHYKMYDGNFLVAYPERTFSATFNLDAGGPDYRGNARLGWSSFESIDFTFYGGSNIDIAQDIYFNMQLSTPFDGWKHNVINGGVYYIDNLLLINGSAIWAESQNLAVAFMGDYHIEDPQFKCEIKLGLNSTIRDIPTINAHIKHLHDNKKFDSEVGIRHTPFGNATNVFSVRSIWYFEITEKQRNITGSIALRSPFAGYRTGALSTKFSLSEKKQIRGAADLDLEEKKFTLSVEGHVKKFTDNMLVTNITTPIEKFRNIIGRFGINEKERHIVMEVRGPQNALGVELIFAIQTVTDFNVKFNLETPLEAFEKIMIIGKIKPETIDFRGAWNKIMLGYIGVSRLASLNDFEYSSKVFTPIENFVENGFVAKFIKKEDFDLELSLKFAKYKLGIVINSKPKPKIMRQLGLKLTHELLNDLLDDDDIFKNHDNENIVPNDGDVVEYDNDDDDDNFDDDEEPISFIGYMELFTLVWPTITGTLDVEEIDDTYLSYGTLKLPNGPLEIRDKFYYPDYFTMKNTLKILTPFSNVREIRNVYEHSIDLGNFYIIGLDISVLNVSRWLAGGFKFNYTTITDEAELKTHDVHLHIHTPLSVLPIIDLKSNIELEDSTYRANFSATSIDTKVSISGSLESDENFLDVTAGLELYSPPVPKYIHKVYFKKDLSDIENTIDLGWEVWDNELFNNFHIETAWQLDKHNYVNVKGAIRNNIIGIKQLEMLVYLIKSPNLVASVDFAYALEEIPAALEKLHAKVSRKKEHVHCELTSTIQHIGNVSIQGSLSQIAGDLNGAHNLMGNLYRNSEVYTINGTVTLQSDIPIEIILDLKSLQNESNSGAIEYSLKEVENGYGNIFKFNATNADQFIQIVGGYSLFNMINWKLILAVVTSNNILSNSENLNRMNLNTSIAPTQDGFTLAQFKLNTPFTELGLESIQLSSVLNISQNSGNIRNSYEISPTMKGNSFGEWSWIVMENMLFMWDSVTENSDNLKRVFKTGIKYENPMRNMRELSVGVHLNVHDLWNFESKGSLTYLSKSDIGIGLAVGLPQPVGDYHIFSGRYRSETNAEDSNMDVNYELKYEAEEARTRLASRGLFRNATDMQSLLRFEWGKDIRFDAVEVNLQMLRKVQRRELSGRLVTPFYIEDTLLLTGAYDLHDIYQLYSGKINYPATRQIADGDIAYSSLSNVKGYVNTTTPFQNLTWLRGDFDFTTTGSQSTRFIKARWPKDTATFDLKTTNSYLNFERDVQGIINIEAPLTTRHFVIIDYSLKERGPMVTGHANVEYNKKNVLKGMYTSKTEISTGHEKNVIDIALENDFKPIGVSYVHQREYSDIIDLPHYDMKRAEIYELRNSKLINITGEVHIKTTMTGQDYRIIAIHPNRTVIFTSNYDYKNQTTKHKSRLELANSVWFAYDLMLHNFTKDNNESQSYSLLFSYPKRNISTDGWYAVTENAFDSDISFQWTRNSKSDNDDDDDSYDNGYDDNTNDDNSPRVMRAALQWRNEPLAGDAKDNQTLVLTIRHPSFVKDVKFSGFYYKSPVDLFNSKLIVDYCDDLDHLLTLESVIRDLSTIVGYRNYTLLILGHHEISEFNLDVRGSVGSHLGLYETLNLAQYKRGYIPLQEGFLIGKIDLQQKEINYMKQTPYKTVRFYSKADGKFPVYTINGTVEDSPDINSTGQFFINIENKYIRLNINMTPDASQNLYMLGVVPDARSASFDLWRDYEDIRVIDVAYYLRMNHSRLVTSQLLWRPKLKMEFKEKIRGMAVSFYESLSENVDFWIKTLYTESMDTVNDLWRNAKPHTQRFLNDVGGLRVLEDDIEEFRIFLNQSYEANDFYVKTVVNFTLTIIDELAIRNHIGSVPKILSEVWHVLGDSGQALRRSILWLIDTIKTSYKKTLEIISKILHGESLEHISAIIEKAVARYDTFIKDLHLKLIKHVENMWATMADMLGNYWKRSLHRIEPSIIKFLHYIETMIWNISKEIFDFLYKRTNELIESPYFNKVSNFTQDLDRLYKDLMANDALTNIKKYAVLAWQFLKEKYFKVVPFGKEMHDVMSELFEEIKALKNLEIIKVINSKINEVQMKLDWLAENLQLDQRVIQLWDMIRNKITRIAQTALQADDKYREAKTKFIFDPDNGVMELEQKLPMSWHSFNETPKFEEIPEYKLLIDIQKYFNGNNFSIWNYYYEFKPYMDPNNWLPPFKSYALLIGSRHIVTFDKRFTSINFKYDLINTNRKPAQCSYLLAHDFVDSNFTLILEPSIVKHNADLISTKKLALITENDMIDIDIVEFSVRVGKELKSTLPIQIGDAVIYRDADMLMIESNKGFTLHCNLQFDFCWFELSGWYYGKTAGLFGTMNNEHFDEFTTSTNVIINDANMDKFIGNSDRTVADNDINNNNNNMNEFINSWSFGAGCSSQASQTNSNIYNNHSLTAPIHIVNMCDSLFKNKLSYFANCFTIIDPQPFYKMCLDLGTNSISNYIDVKHPAQKGTCTAALGYIEACAVENTPLRIPDSCVYCDLLNGTYVPEGTFMMLKDKDVPMTTDIVFIIEAKSCNADISTNKNIMSLINVLNKELTDRNIKNNRYAVITFGGVSPFDKPRSIVYNGQIFTDHINIKHYFDHIMTGPSNFSDIFEAISTATKLIFRLGTSKTFILMPCSACNPTNMRLDYSSMIQVLLEENINLHILMDEPFDLDKKRIERVFFGMDRKYVYTKKYLKEQIGDVDLRRQIVLPKKQLGVCTSLAIETNGTIFTSRKLRPGNRNPIKKFTSVFAKRIASTADPKQCQTCECTGHNTGIAYMTCTSCEIPNPWNLDYDFNENEMLSIMQSGTDFNWGDDYD